MVDLEKSERYKGKLGTESVIRKAVEYDMEFLRLGEYREYVKENKISSISGYRTSDIAVDKFKEEYKLPLYYEESSILFEKDMKKYNKGEYLDVDVSIENNGI